MIIMFKKEEEKLVNEFKNSINPNDIEDTIECESLSGDEWIQIIVFASALISTNVVRFLVHYMKLKRIIVKDNYGRIIEARNVDDAIKIIKTLDEKERLGKKD